MAKKSNDTPLGYREREIVETVYRLGEAAVSGVLDELPDPPSYSTVRAILGSLVRKKVLRQRRDGKRYVYRPAVAKDAASKSAMRQLLETFFSGQPADAVAALLEDDGVGWSEEDLKRLKRLIEQKRNSKQR